MMLERGPDRVSPFAIPLSVANMGAGQVSIELGLRGPVTAVCTACAAGTDAIGVATETIRRGDARAMLAGGGDTLISPYFVAGFNAMRVLSHRNDDPAGAARPFDEDRDGFLVGEAGAVVVLERLEDALARGARIFCEVAGYGASADAHHITDPDPSALPQARAVRAALDDAGLRPEDVDHVNAHGGASKPGDPAEVKMLQLVLGEEVAARVAVSATKSMHGHCMGATGALEAAITALALKESMLPPTINLHTVDPACVGVDHVANVARPAELRVALSASLRPRRPQRRARADPPRERRPVMAGCGGLSPRAEKTIRLVVTCAMPRRSGIIAVATDNETLGYIAVAIVLAGIVAGPVVARVLSRPGRRGLADATLPRMSDRHPHHAGPPARARGS